MSVTTVETTALHAYAAFLKSAGTKYEQCAANQHETLDEVRTSYNITAYVVAAEMNAADEMSSRASAAVLHIASEIERLQRELAIELANVDASDFAHLSDDPKYSVDQAIQDTRTRTTNSYNVLIQMLEVRKKGIEDFMNIDLVKFKTSGQAAIDKSKAAIAELDGLTYLEMGHVYVSLRLLGASSTIETYATDVVTNEEKATQAFLRTLPTVVPEGETIDPNSEIGVDWRKTEADLVAMAESGFVPLYVPGPLEEAYILPGDFDGDGLLDSVDPDPHVPTAPTPAPTPEPAPTPAPTPAPAPQPTGMGRGGPGTSAYEYETEVSDGPAQSITTYSR